MSESILSRIAVWAILLIFILIFAYALYNPKFGLMQKISKIALGAERFLPDTAPLELRQDSSLPETAIPTQEKFIQEMASYKDEYHCLLQISSLSGLQDQTLELSNINNGIQVMIGKQAGKEETGRIKLNPKNIEGNFKLCVIESDAFYNCYIGSIKDCSKKTYKDVTSVQLSKDGITLDGIPFSLNDGLIFKPDTDKLCFVPEHTGVGEHWYSFVNPARWGCDSSSNSIDSGCTSNLKIIMPMCASQSTSKTLEDCQAKGGKCSKQCTENEVAIMTLRCTFGYVCCTEI